MNKSYVFKFDSISSKRIDQALPLFLEEHGIHGGVTRSQIKRWIGEGRVSVNAKVVTKAGYILEPGDEVEVEIEPTLQEEFPSYDFKLDIRYEDESLVVINKPAGLSMHPGAGHKANTLVNALVAHCGIEFAQRFDSRPGIVHRLDKDTSGLIVVAKTQEVLALLSKQFSNRSVNRRYLALVLSGPRKKGEIDLSDQGTIDTLIGRDPNNRFYFRVSEDSGKRAITSYAVIERFAYANLVEVKLSTGRTHQIRVHMQHLGSPVIGDKLYGDFSSLPSELGRISKQFGRQALHAKTLGFIHPRTESALDFESEPPSDMRALIESFRSYK